MLKTFFAAPKNASEAARQARIIARAERLLADGYRIQQFGKTPLYAIFKPENPNPKNGWRDYLVNMTPFKEQCNCEGFVQDKDCKHRIAVAIEIEERKALEIQAAEYEAMMQASESEQTGCDPFAEF